MVLLVWQFGQIGVGLLTPSLDLSSPLLTEQPLHSISRTALPPGFGRVPVPSPRVRSHPIPPLRNANYGTTLSALRETSGLLFIGATDPVGLPWTNSVDGWPAGNWATGSCTGSGQPKAANDLTNDGPVQDSRSRV
jgi:hypothetical protein